MNSEKGFSLIEVLIALAVVAVVAVVLLTGMSTTFRTVMVSQGRVVAEGLAKSQLEHLRTQDYISAADYDAQNPEKRYALINIPADLVSAGYAIEINPPQTITIPSEGSFQLQSVTVVIKRNGEEMFTILNGKAGRES